MNFSKIKKFLKIFKKVLTIRKFHDIIHIEDKTRTTASQEVYMKFYEVRWMEKGVVKTKIFKYLKSAEKYGFKKSCEYDITLYVNGIRNNITYYAGGFKLYQIQC